MAKIKVQNNGPLIIEGELKVFDAEGKEFGLAGRTKLGLCRCGHSRNKPFCDGAHKAAGFESKCEAKDLPPPKVKP